MTNPSGSGEPTQPVDGNWSQRSVRPAERSGLIGLLGPDGICYLAAALFVALGLVMAALWSPKAAIPDYNNGPNSYGHGFYWNCGTLFSPQLSLGAIPGAEFQASANPNPGPPPANWKPPPTPGHSCGAARRPVFIAEFLTGLAALVALIVGFNFRRNRTSDALAAKDRSIEAVRDVEHDATQDHEAPPQPVEPSDSGDPPERVHYPWLS